MSDMQANDNVNKPLKFRIDFRRIVASESFKAIVSAVICALVGILVGFIILLLINAQNAPKAMATILKNFFYYKRTNMRLMYFGETLVNSVPLILCALSVLFAYKSGLFNIGVGGQYCLGIGVTLWCAIQWNLPWYMCVLIAVLASALWGAIAGAFKAFFNVNEVIACIMMNWISLNLVNALMLHNETIGTQVEYTIMDIQKAETFKIAVRSPQSLLPTLGLGRFFGGDQYVTIAIPLTILVAVFIYIILNKTTFGYELRATGLNKNAAKYAGMKDKFNVVLTMAIAGALGGLAASLFYLTDFQQWKTSSSVPGMGFSGIAVAFLGGLNPIGVLFAGYFIQHLTTGGSLIDMRYYNPQIADLIASIIIYMCGFVLFFKSFIARLAERKSDAEANNANATESEDSAGKDSGIIEGINGVYSGSGNSSGTGSGENNSDSSGDENFDFGVPISEE